jgi:hypothetical protein
MKRTMTNKKLVRFSARFSVFTAFADGHRTFGSRSGPKSREAAAFSAMGELGSSLPLCRRRQCGNKAQECTCARAYPARGNSLDMVHSFAFKFLMGHRCGGKAQQKSPESRVFRDRACFRRTSEDWENYIQKERHVASTKREHILRFSRLLRNKLCQSGRASPADLYAMMDAANPPKKRGPYKKVAA